MNNWRDAILNAFVLGVSKLTLVADPDNLLTEEKMALTLRDRGFDLIEFDDPVEFRYVYETKYRSIWDRGEHTDLVVILRLQSADLETLPYDLLQTGRKLSFNLSELFPNLSYSVLEKLDRSFLDSLFDAQHKSNSNRLGNNATKDFILRYVFNIAVELISSDVELLRTLLRLHYGEVNIPATLAQRLVHVLCKQSAFANWPLNEIVHDDNAFYAFLQERWPLFLDSMGQSSQINKDPSKYKLIFLGPDILPFDHQDIKVYIDNLFIERKLEPLQTVEKCRYANSWVRCGIVTENENDKDKRISRLFELVEKNIPTEESLHSDWILFSLKWAELSALVHIGENPVHQTQLNVVGDCLNAVFAAWLMGHYGNLINLSPANPAMLHHVPRRLARTLENTKDSRVALIVMDGLALDQWCTIRQILQKRDRDLVVRESATFAWIPTLTSVSRQSIFSGKPPLYFPSSINSTNREEKLWKQFWEEYGLSRLDVAYQRGLGDGEASSVLDSAIHPSKTKAVGLVVDKVDKIMHGMQLGSAGMHNQIKQWCQAGFLSDLIGLLLGLEYEVWLTSDHGNIQCDGKGRPSEGAIAETRGERVRVYPTPELRSQVASSFPFAHEWPPLGLPEDYFPLVASGRDAFVNPGESIVGHGGISIEEVIVPLIKFERKTR